MSNTSTANSKKILVTGSTGKTGRRVLQKLTDRGVPALGASTTTTPKFDWTDTTTWENVLNNIDYLFISYYPDLAVPGAAKTIEQFTAMAVSKGVQKLVLLSGRGEEEALACEKVVMNAGVDWSIVRCSWFSQNFSEGNFLEPVLAGHVALPVGDIGEPFIDADDIADVAVATLTEEGHSKKLYELTGPRLLTFKDAVEEIAKATGREIRFERIPFKAYSSMLAEYGLPKDLVWLVTYLFTEVLDGRNASIKDGVQEALGRKPIDFSEYVKKTAATGVWG
jgi:uncharacterized protein YbjT (DUF2867 family)